ncbi:unnamed protein product [Heligmosomoides polygyrus]|uniref:Uncharacterized protein n=1 Tax=Heligmosomoides polygyrus TaxID=6339 RepID=A0A183FQQ5_HELPZ|nr:unnamed protein product [Heligmosomoides polygyrus]
MHFVTVLFIIPALVTAHNMCYRGNAKSYSYTYKYRENFEVHHQKALEEIRQAFAATRGVNQIDNPFEKNEYRGDLFFLELKELEATFPGQNPITVKELIGYDTKQFRKVWVTYIVNDNPSGVNPKIVLAQNGAFEMVEGNCIPLFSPDSRLYL